MNILRVFFFVSSLALLSSQAIAQNWPQFRGEGSSGVAADNPALPMTWDKDQNVVWKTKIPGLGWACPVVFGDRVFVSTVSSDGENEGPSAGLYLGKGVREPAKGEHHWLVYCFDLNTGKEIWKREVHTGQPVVPRHPKSTYAAETPTTDGERLFVLFGDLGLWCFDFEGNELWKRSIEPQKTFFDYGAAASPVVHDGQVIVVYDNLEDSWICSFGSVTGKDNWRKNRDEQRSWATPDSFASCLFL